MGWKKTITISINATALKIIGFFSLVLTPCNGNLKWFEAQNIVEKNLFVCLLVFFPTSFSIKFYQDPKEWQRINRDTSIEHTKRHENIAE